MPIRPLLLDLPMPIRTPRLIIQPVHADHAVQFQQAIEESRNHLYPWMVWAKEEKTLDDRREFMTRKYAQFILRESMMMLAFTQNGDFVVSTGYHNIDWDIGTLEIGYWCRASATGKGYVTEACNALTRYAFDRMQMRKVTIAMDSENRASESVPIRLNIRKEFEEIGGTQTLHEGNALRTAYHYSCFDTKALPLLTYSCG